MITNLKKSLMVLTASITMMTSSLSADPIVYSLTFPGSVSNTTPASTLTGTLTTDGTIGAINLNNILAWSLTQTGPHPFSIMTNTADSSNTYCTSGCLTASLVGNISTLSFDFSSTSALFDPFFQVFDSSPFLEINFFNKLAFQPVGGIQISDGLNITTYTASTDGVLGTATVAVPEPATYATMAGLLLLLAIGNFSRRKLASRKAS